MPNIRQRTSPYILTHLMCPLPGQVDPTTMEVVLSAPVRFHQNWGNLDSFDVVGLASKSYMLVFNNGTSRINGAYGTGPLMGIYATVTANVVTLSDTAVLQSDASPILNLVATAVSDTSAVVAFADYNHNYAINTQLVYVKNGAIGTKKFLHLYLSPHAHQQFPFFAFSFRCIPAAVQRAFPGCGWPDDGPGHRADLR